MPRQNKKGKNELDSILEQLKKSYGSDSLETLEDDLLEDEKSEDDEELSAILGKIFGNDTNDISPQSSDNDLEGANSVSEEETSQEEVVAKEIAREESETVTEKEITVAEKFEESVADKAESESEIFVEDESASEDLNIADPVEVDSSEISQPDEDNSDIAAVDNILSLMFSGKPAADIPHHTEANAISEIIDSTVEDSAVEADGASIEEEIDEIESILIEEESNEEDNFEEFVEENDVDLEEIEDEEFFEDIVDVESEDLPVELEVEEEFAVADEEYSLEKYYDTRLEELYEKFEKAFSGDGDAKLIDDESEADEISPKLILTPDLYTYDPLQDSFKSIEPVKLPVSVLEKRKVNKAQDSDKKVINESKEETFDDNDISLLLKFGYDSEIRSQIGEEKTQKVILDKDKNFVPDSHSKVFGFCGKELSSRRQISEISEKYKFNQRNLIIILAVVSLITLFIFSLTAVFEVSINKVSTFPFFVLLEFSLVLTMMTVLYKKLLSGVNKLIKLEISTNTILCLVAIAYVIYTFVALTVYLIDADSLRSDDLVLFGFSVSIYALISLISDYLNCIREKRAFGIISENQEIYTAENQSTDFSKKISNDNRKSQSSGISFMIRKAKLVSGYFRKTSDNNHLPIKPIYLIGVAPAIALAVGCATFFISESIMLSVVACMMTVLCCIPVSCIFSTNLIDFVIAKFFLDKNVAYIGTEAPEKLAEASSLVFLDTDLIDVVGFTEICPDASSSNSDEYKKTAYSIFYALGGPLSKLCPDSIKSEKIDSRELIINKISDNGIDLYFNSSVNVLIGDKQFMRLHNIRVKTDTNLLTATKGADASVIFMAFDGVPRLGFIINSAVKQSFINVAELIISSEKKIAVKTYEPQINDLYFEQSKAKYISGVTVIKPQTFETLHNLDMCDGDIVSTDAMSLAEAVCSSAKISKFRSINKKINMLIVIGSILLSAVLAVLLSLNFFNVDLFELFRSHITTVFNVLMLATLIPAIVEIIIIIKNRFPSK